MHDRQLEYRLDTEWEGQPAVATAPHVPAAQRNRGMVPDYLVRHYGWAYLWPISVWLLDHQPLINAILFGQYRRIMTETRRLMGGSTAGKTLQIAAVYGKLIPTLAAELDELHLCEVAPIQLRAARRKLKQARLSAHLARMNAEELFYADDSFDTALMFLLLHELPPAARRRSLREAVRVLRPGGRIVIAEYGEARRRHFLHRVAPMRWILTKSEPFLADFWREDLAGTLAQCAAEMGKEITLEEQVDIFGGFYRVMRFRVARGAGSSVTVGTALQPRLRSSGPGISRLEGRSFGARARTA